MGEANQRRLNQYLQTAERIAAQYRGEEPFARFLTNYFRANRQMGSRDRRMASRLLYNLFRLGKALAHLPFGKRAVLADFLCGEDPRFVEVFTPELLPHFEQGLDGRISALEQAYGFQLVNVFPLIERLSPSIDQAAFLASHLVQPDLFIRIRRGFENELKSQLARAEVGFKEGSPRCLALPNGTPLDKIKVLRGKYEVQDYSSQQTVDYMSARAGESWWDACAGSGGKSLLLHDTVPDIRLLVSDTRMTILRNLDERFDAAGVTDYRRKIMDLTKSPEGILGDERFDGVIVDAPCSGSGTWGRTPESLSYFDPNRIPRFTSLQRDIVKHAAPFVRVGKPLIYITCSVFVEENEKIVEYMESHCGLQMERMDILRGYRHRADTMFVARMIRL